ncbi:hypothetical protein KN839_004370 [Salmonella enterica]|nr:hypothetical protein [Salmonella enterica]ECN7768028.1 hypothetical protein [Salmonella enterica subsp. enterica serovar Enteritidis]EDE7122846.1 hypothetical protein [Salmonella enterica subsp. enterica serovar Hvittingfoss]EDF0161749.1 hypothetical protein [Salmonella enterica subsp. enterica serovar Kisangani]EDU8832348.1 hypothetical protein [Salmonella enterica subsp. enterica]HEC8710337.1 hypothetical protein [Salmonella enterica subsp. enterica serovar Poona]
MVTVKDRGVDTGPVTTVSVHTSTAPTVETMFHGCQWWNGGSSRMPYHKPASGQSNLPNQEHYESGTTYVDTGTKY